MVRRYSFRKIGLVVLLLPASLLSFSRGYDEKDVLDKLILNPELSVYVNLVAKAGLLETLKSGSAFTIFAPNNAAFAKLPPTLLPAIKKDKALLRKFVMFHMLDSRLESKDFKLGSLKTSAGESLSITINKTVLMVSRAKVVAIDDKASNGVVHVLDTVLFAPSMGKLVPKAATPPVVPP